MTTYTLFGQPATPATLASDTTPYTMGMEFTLSGWGALTGIWFYSATGAGSLPNQCGIYTVSGTSQLVWNSSATWSGAAGSGWVKCTFDGSVTLAPGTAYKVCVYNADLGGTNWYSATSHYWDTGTGAGGLTSGIITAPNNAGADGGQDTFNTPTVGYPDTSFNAANYWVDVEVSVVTTFRLMDGVAGRPGVSSSGTQPPASATAFSGSYVAGLVWNVSAGGLYINGYWWWVPGTNGNTTAQTFALWQVLTSTTGILVAAATVASGAFTAGQWNFIPLSPPLALTANIPYLVATGLPSSSPKGFPDTQNQFGSGQPYSAGITNGPLFAYGQGAGGPQQSPFSTAGFDPTTVFPSTNDLNDLLWLDVQVTDVPPSGASYRAWPNMQTPLPAITTANDTTGYTLGMEFSLSKSCTLDRIWHFSCPAGILGGNAVFPTRCLIWDVLSQTAVSGTDNPSPTWHDPGGGAASPGDGWVYCDYTSSGVTLNASQNYKVSTFHAAGATWFGATGNVYGVSDLQAAGFTQGPLAIPGNAAATSPGQQSWNTVTFGYPSTSTNPEADWIDVEVTPLAGPGPATPVPLIVTRPAVSRSANW